MITNERIIHPLEAGSNKSPAAIQVAAACYLKWKSAVPFEQDVAEYLSSGCVLSYPHLFALARMIELNKEPAWFIRIAVGRLPDLLATLPWHTKKIAFCRRNDGRMRVYSLERLIRRAMKGD